MHIIDTECICFPFDIYKNYPVDTIPMFGYSSRMDNRVFREYSLSIPFQFILYIRLKIIILKGSLYVQYLRKLPVSLNTTIEFLQTQDIRIYATYQFHGLSFEIIGHPVKMLKKMSIETHYPYITICFNEQFGVTIFKINMLVEEIPSPQNRDKAHKHIFFLTQQPIYDKTNIDNKY